MTWTTKVTGFALVEHNSTALMVRHDRLGVVRWEAPGGHINTGESLEETTAREVREETGVDVSVGVHVGTCVHDWFARRQRRIIVYFAAKPTDPAAAVSVPDEGSILDVDWLDPRKLPPEETSPFLHPFLEWWPNLPDRPLFMNATHIRGDDGNWLPQVTEVIPARE